LGFRRLIGGTLETSSKLLRQPNVNEPSVRFRRGELHPGNSKVARHLDPMLHGRMTGEAGNHNAATDERLIWRLLVVVNHPHGSIRAVDFRGDTPAMGSERAAGNNRSFQFVFMIVFGQRPPKTTVGPFANVREDVPGSSDFMVHRKPQSDHISAVFGAPVTHFAIGKNLFAASEHITLHLGA
jgi:hypothetical protein